MSTHEKIRRGLCPLLGMLCALHALEAQTPSGMPECAESAALAPPVPAVTATIRAEFLKDDKTLIQDLYLSPGDGVRIRAFVIKPYKPSVAAGGAILFVHWLGNPPANDRSEFFAEAMALADQNVTSLLIDAPWAEPEWFPGRKLEDDPANTARYAAQLQGYLRYLLATAKPDPEKIAIVGHDLGAMYGALVMRRDPAIRHAVVMAAVGDFGDWFVLGRALGTADSMAYRERMRPFAPTHFLHCAKPKDLLFQFAETDRFVTRIQAAALADASSAEKTVLWYAGGHELQDASRKDRLEWLRKRLGPDPD